jgi:hypothetical protein
MPNLAANHGRKKSAQARTGAHETPNEKRRLPEGKRRLFDHDM